MSLELDIKIGKKKMNDFSLYNSRLRNTNLSKCNEKITEKSLNFATHKDVMDILYI